MDEVIENVYGIILSLVETIITLNVVLTVWDCTDFSITFSPIKSIHNGLKESKMRIKMFQNQNKNSILLIVQSATKLRKAGEKYCKMWFCTFEREREWEVEGKSGRYVIYGKGINKMGGLKRIDED